MKFVIGSSSNIKVFAKSVLTLSKLGDEIYIEPTPNSLTIRAVNASRSAFARISFNASFFTHFEAELFRNGNNKTLDDSEMSRSDETSFKCKIPAKSLLSIFKNINSLEKNVEKCSITVKHVPISQDTAANKVYDFDSTMLTRMLNENHEEQLYDTKFLIILNCKYGMRKTFILSISDCENLQTAFTHHHCTSRLNISAKHLHETINSFSAETEEVSFCVDSKRLLIKNYVEPENVDVKIVNTQVSFDCDEFEMFQIEKDLEITFCLKELKQLLMFGAGFELNVDVYFKSQGRPIIFDYSNGSGGSSAYEANFTLATLVDGISITPSQNTTMSNTNLNMSSALENENNEAAPPLSLKTSKSVGPVITTTARNKRTLYDSSNNQVYLAPEAQKNANNNSSDEDDVLLTQMLDQQEKTAAAQQKPEQPPSKKIKSLVQTLFEDNDTESEDDNDAINKNLHKTKQNNSIRRMNGDEIEIDVDSNSRDADGATVAKKKTISFVNFVNNTLNISQKEEMPTIGTSIYIEETDSEEE